MIKFLLIFTAIAGLFLTACEEKSDSTKENTETNDVSDTFEEKEIPYTVAEKYFLKNTVEEIGNPMIESGERFHELFGSGSTMNSDARPTEIDFSESFVIAIMVPKTEHKTSIEPIKLHDTEDGKVVLNYKVTQGEKQSYTTQPVLILIVDNSYKGELELNKM